MSLDSRIKRVILDLEDICDQCRYSNEREAIRKAIECLNFQTFNSDKGYE